MKKIPTLFKREFENHTVVKVLPEVTDGCECYTDENCKATVKVDGSCTAIIDGVYYKRYDAKKGKTPPVGAIPCCEPDPITGHHPHWVKVEDTKENIWYINAYNNSNGSSLPNGTYEAIGPHFQNNPYGLDEDILMPHGIIEITDLDRSFDGIKNFLQEHHIEGIVFWYNDEPLCKIKRSDFGFEWNNKKEK